MPDITIIGAAGFIGKNAVEALRGEGADVSCVNRGEVLEGCELGTVVYCAGVTGDFLANPRNLAEAHVDLAARILENNRVDKIIYLSSTRVYGFGTSSGIESTELQSLLIDAGKVDSIYDCSKIFGELMVRAICERTGTDWTILRLSNVVGFEPDSPNSLWTLIHEFSKSETLTFRGNRLSAKDYVSLDEVCRVICLTAGGDHDGAVNQVVNVASGRCIANRDLPAFFGVEGDCGVSYDDGVEPRIAPNVSVQRVVKILGRKPENGLSRVSEFVSRIR